MINFKTSSPVLGSSNWILEYNTLSTGHEYIMYPEEAFDINKNDYYRCIISQYKPILNVLEYIAFFMKVDCIIVNNTKLMAKNTIR